MFERMALIGVGLIGSSLARAVRAHGLSARIVGAEASSEAAETALALGIVDEMVADPAAAVVGADLVVVCTPLGVYGEVAKAIGPALSAGAIVTDIGSVKSGVAETFAPHLADGAHIVPGHPVAGSEKSGPEFGFAEMFAQRWAILTPPPGADQAAVGKLRALWEGVGSSVELMDAVHHDRVLAITSHLPHLIAYSIVSTVSDLEDQLRAEVRDTAEQVSTDEVVKFSAGGFRDFTRIAGSNPVMWRDVFLMNREPVLEMLGRFTEDLTALQRAIRWGKGDDLHEIFARTRALRTGIIEAGQAGTFSPVEPPATGVGGTTEQPRESEEE